ncbi:MAG: DNA repair protein RecN [Alphaproteobacteria bacterium]|nr:DNA repair protein RecN [Alphaproteobacteria bacterium]MBN2780279.1 DNA repair protein RecN [Alphaproteobacteria bacterium]
MLSYLSINNVVLIDSLELPLSKGLSVLTGETGAGKSILLDALGLALGMRSDKGLIRSGEDKASVVAEFSLPANHPVYTFLRENDIEIDPCEPLLIRRVVFKGGESGSYSKAYLNDQPIGVRLLSDIGDYLVEIHGQFENHGLMNPKTHQDLLDAFAGVDSEKIKTKKAHFDWKTIQKEREILQRHLAKAKEDEDYLRHTVKELEDLNPQPGEEEELANQRALLMQAEKNISNLQEAYEALTGGSEDVGSRFRMAQNALVRAGDESLSSLIDEIGEAWDTSLRLSDKLEALVKNFENPQAELEKAEERLFALRALARKHRCLVDELPAMYEKLSKDLNMVAHSDETLKAKMAEEAQAKETYYKEALALYEKRRVAAKSIAEMVHIELAPLKLEHANFEVTLEKLDEENWRDSGFNTTVFTIAMNPGSPQTPIHKTASGGELARLMLALKVVLAKLNPVPVMVFDEVDTGISGATADAVGARLKRLADTVQVLVITHSPQVASKGTFHLKVHKSASGDMTTTTVYTLSDDDRLQEIARLLSGDEITKTALQNAQDLLNQ